MVRWLSLFALVLSAACGSDAPSAPAAPSAVGTWMLESIGGRGLPYLLAQVGTNKVELMEAALQVKSGGSFSATSTERTTTNGVIESQLYIDPGRFSVSGSTVSFRFDDGSIAHATVARSTITFEGATPVVYRRR